MAEEKRLIVAPASWSGEVAAILAAAMRCDPGASVATLRELVESGRATLFHFLTEEGEVAGAAVLQAEPRELGADGVIVAAATRWRWVWRYLPALLGELERKFYGVGRVRIHTGNVQLAAWLREQGYQLREVVLWKPLSA